MVVLLLVLMLVSVMLMRAEVDVGANIAGDADSAVVVVVWCSHGGDEDQ